METSEPRRHIILSGNGEGLGYTTPPRDMSDLPAPSVPTNRRSHGQGLQQHLIAVPNRHREAVEAHGLGDDELHNAYYLTFQIDSISDFKVESLAPYQTRTGIRLLSSRAVQTDLGETLQEITVFVPQARLEEFQKKVAEYLSTVDDDKPKRSGQIDRWRSVDLASIHQFYTDHAPYPADDQSVWWEVWLQYEPLLETPESLGSSGGPEDSNSSMLDDLRVYCEQFGIQLADKGLVIDDRLIILARATPLQWSAAPLILGFLAEFRLARELATPFLGMTNQEQRDWTNSLADRLLQLGANMPAVCILDSGVNRGHPLLEASLAAQDQHKCVLSWGVDDVADINFIGHGTCMAGLALLGERLPDLALSTGDVELRHRIESVKILPRTGGNSPDLHAVRTVEATTGPETQAPDRRRVFALAVTASSPEGRGEPSLWAAAIDAMAVGRGVYPDADHDRLEQLTEAPVPSDARLWVISAGNHAPSAPSAHPEASDEQPIASPAESWNAVCVGAMTSLHRIAEATDGAREVAAGGELSPFSRTSVAFDPDRPVKPEIVMEGGNAHVDSSGNVDTGHSDLSLLTTSQNLLMQQFTWFNGTSAASALAARQAARIWADYPELWPETVRGLLIHSARWTDAMQSWFNPLTRKSERLDLLRRYGWGVPQEDLALRCLGNKMTLICQDQIQPFDDQGQYHEMRIHRLPWPAAALADLGEERVRLRVTLSTFVDPHPSRRGRYAYPSHQLRFALKPAGEDAGHFLARLNKQARDDNYQADSSIGRDRWYFGSDARTRGSVFCDIWKGSGQELAECSQIAVLPVTGWWKDKKIDRSVRYALILSIETESQQADLWQEVANIVEAQSTPVPITP